MSNKKKTTAPWKAKTAHDIPEWIWISIIFLFSISLYVNTIPNGYVLDDGLTTPLRASVGKGIKGIPEILTSLYFDLEHFERKGDYRPVALITFAIEAHFFGKDPHISHFLNIIIYALISILVFIVLQTLFKGYTPLFPFLITLLFIAYPRHSEVVASLKNREQLLSFLFAFLSLYSFLKYYAISKTKWAVLGVLFFLIGFFSKSATITFALLIPLTLFFFNYTNIKNSILLFLILFILPIGLYLGILSFFETNASTFTWAENPLASETNIANLIATQVYILGYYIKMIILPVPMMTLYGAGIINIVTWSNPWVWLSLITYSFLIFYAFYNIKNKSIPSYAIFYYLIALSLYMNIVYFLPSVVADRFVFNAVLGFFILFVYLLFTLSGLSLDTPTSLFSAKSLTCISIVSFVLLFYSYTTIDRNKDWKDSVTLLASDLKHWDNAPFGTYWYAQFLKQEALLQEIGSKKRNDYIKEALKYYKKTIQLYPEDPIALREIGYIYCQMLNDQEKGMHYLQESLSVNDSFYITYYFLSDCESDSIAKLKYKIEFYKSFLNKNKNKDNLPLKSQLVIHYYQLGNIEEAIKVVNNMEQINPNSTYTHFSLGIIRLHENNKQKAVFHFEKALALSKKENVALRKQLPNLIKKYKQEIEAE